MPILLSVGYAACHWCHVMAHESFEDDVTAAFINDHFVSVKVDREERPDVDAVYMQATQAMTGQGGWPMTVRADPGRRPFFAGTYFPAEADGTGSRPSGRCWPRSPTRGRTVAPTWPTSPADVGPAQSVDEPGGDEPIDADGRWPAPSTLWRASSTPEPAGSAARRSSRRAWCWSSCSGSTPGPGPTRVEPWSTATLEAMARGGIYDQLAGGFARY